MSELRWILLGIGVVAIAGIWWWSARRSRQAPGNAELREPTIVPLTLTAQTLDTPRAAQRRGSDPRSTQSRELEEAAAEPRDEGRELRAPDASEPPIPDLEPVSLRAEDFAYVPALDQPLLTQPDPIDFSLDSSQAIGTPRFPSMARELVPPKRTVPPWPAIEDEEPDTDATTVSTPAIQLPLEEDMGAAQEYQEAAQEYQGAAQEDMGPPWSEDVATLAPAGDAPGSDDARTDDLEPIADRGEPSGPAEAARPSATAASTASGSRWRAASEHSDRYSTMDPQTPNSSERQKIVALRVCAVGETRWSGATLINALEIHGLAYGRYQVFHRRHGDGRSIFCVASLVEPGTFDLASMPGETYRGVSLFAVLPGPIDAVQIVEAMLDAGRELARELSGSLQDAKGMPFSPQREEALLDDVSRFQALLA